MERALLVFAKWPTPGRVKTRLSPAVPPDLACDLQRAMLDDTLAAASAAGASRRELWWADAPPGPEPTRLAERAGLVSLNQVEGDLGARLGAAFAAPRAGPIVIVGSDAPELTAGVIENAFAALVAHDLVLGPTPDGGFYLIGLARPVTGLFDGIAWSSERTLADTRARAETLGLRTALLEPLADVDTPGDLVALVGRLLESPGASPATAAALAKMGLLPATVPGSSEPSGSGTS